MISLDRMVQKHAAKSKQNHILINEKIKTDIIYKSHNKGGEAKMITKDDRAYKTEASFGFFDVINALGNDFSNIYSVDCESQNVEIYRYENQNVGVKEALQEKRQYKNTLSSMCLQPIKRKCRLRWILTASAPACARCRILRYITGSKETDGFNTSI